MEKLRKLPKNEFNENLREVYKLDEKVEQFYSKPESEEELERLETWAIVTMEKFFSVIVPLTQSAIKAVMGS